MYQIREHEKKVIYIKIMPRTLLKNEKGETEYFNR